MSKPAKRIDIVTLKTVKERSILYPERKVSSPEKAAELIRPFIEDSDREMFMVLYMNTKNEPVGLHTVSIGTINAALVSPPEVFKAALLSNAAALIVFHNHPSGHIQPSKEDINITKRLTEAGQILGIHVTDHIIIGDEGKYYSFKEENQL